MGRRGRAAGDGPPGTGRREREADFSNIRTIRIEGSGLTAIAWCYARVKADFSRSCTIRTKADGVDAAFMSSQLHERGIHIVRRAADWTTERHVGAKTDLSHARRRATAQPGAASAAKRGPGVPQGLMKPIRNNGSRDRWASRESMARAASRASSNHGDVALWWF
jgi:hypothetical protein